MTPQGFGPATTHKGDTQMTDQQKADAAFAAAHRAAERRADAEALAQYQRDCLASWAGK
jgi:hypothetical protein